jgi:uncharacterized protein (DUF2141 family)
MKSLLVFVLSLTLLTGCQSQPAFTDNGNPGQIKAVVFYDNNRNGIMDSAETGAQVEVGISQDISCPPTSMDKITTFNTDASGIALITDLKPGKYCLHLIGEYSPTTKLTQDIYVSSDMITTVAFGIVKD